MKYVIKEPTLVPYRAVLVLEYTDTGRPCGEYDGYWDPDRNIVKLYPARGSWIYGKLSKKVIRDIEITVFRRTSYVEREG